MITHPAALLLLAACALALLSCARPEPRPPLPDLEQALAQLDAIPGRVEALVERGCEAPVRVEVRAECYYPNRIAAMEVARE